MEKNNNINNVLHYIRVARQEKKHNNMSLNDQRETLQHYTEANNLKIVPQHEALDVLRMELTENTPVLQKLIKDVEKGKYDKIIITKKEKE